MFNPRQARYKANVENHEQQKRIKTSQSASVLESFFPRIKAVLHSGRQTSDEQAATIHGDQNELK